jgi:hypothetical protein
MLMSDIFAFRKNGRACFVGTRNFKNPSLRFSHGGNVMTGIAYCNTFYDFIRHRRKLYRIFTIQRKLKTTGFFRRDAGFGEQIFEGFDLNRFHKVLRE